MVDMLFELAHSEYQRLKKNGRFIDGLRYGKIRLPRGDEHRDLFLSAVAVISNGRIKEIEVYYSCGVIETIREE